MSIALSALRSKLYACWSSKHSSGKKKKKKELMVIDCVSTASDRAY